jgi:hypothetical protein
MGADLTMKFAAILSSIGEKHPMLPRWRPPHQEIRCVRQDIFGQDYRITSTLEAAAQLFQEGGCKKPAWSQAQGLLRGIFRNDIVNGNKLLTS